MLETLNGTVYMSVYFYYENLTRLLFYNSSSFNLYFINIYSFKVFYVNIKKVKVKIKEMKSNIERQYFEINI